MGRVYVVTVRVCECVQVCEREREREREREYITYCLLLGVARFKTSYYTVVREQGFVSGVNIRC